MTNPERPDRKRRHPHQESDTYRTPFQRDRDRVLYSSAFRRLSGVTQVAAVNEQQVLHNRLTHSLKVAQLGRGIVHYLESETTEDTRDLFDQAGLNATVVETAGLVHDIGHPPFGHATEAVLDERLSAIARLDGFEGNAQSFRIVTKLARRRTEHSGLNLTRATLNAMLKYPCPRQETARSKEFTRPAWTDRGHGTKWGAYQSELEDFRWAREDSTKDLRSANAVVMDWADDISYATHDIEDYFRAGLIPLHNLEIDRKRILKHGFNRLNRYSDFDKILFEQAVQSMIEKFQEKIKSPHWDTNKNRAALGSITTKHIVSCIQATELVDKEPFVTVKPAAQYDIEALKELTWFYVIDRPSLAMTQEGQKRIIGSLFDQLTDCLRKSSKSKRIPTQLRAIYQGLKEDREFMGLPGSTKEGRRAKAVADYICLLTEAQAVDLGERLSGRSRNSMFGPWFA
ncbi:dGTP triphosphohydrolase [Amycolatopsis minnesotensis]|uniref:Deoxyguanosinetriphosphate triphosphohydrolase n=1 Tax=Amycolatopsis minnesotensis TaxID=337894 RepID=A0ABN2QCC9_9PSEU